MNEIIAAVRELLEPAPEDPEEPVLVAVDETAARPFAWAEQTLYVYEEATVDTPIETGPVVRQDFTLRAVLTGPRLGEEAKQTRLPAVSTFLDTRRDAYLAAVRASQRTALWGNLRAASAPGPATLQVRSIALRITGYRIV